MIFCINPRFNTIYILIGAQIFPRWWFTGYSAQSFFPEFDQVTLLGHHQFELVIQDLEYPVNIPVVVDYHIIFHFEVLELVWHLISSIINSIICNTRWFSYFVSGCKCWQFDIVNYLFVMVCRLVRFDLKLRTISYDIEIFLYS